MGDNFKASCPICGRNLFRGKKQSLVEGNCSKCGTYLRISYLDNGVTVTVMEEKIKFAEEKR